jgi:hypothetical protein
MMFLFGKTDQGLAWYETFHGILHEHVISDAPHQRFGVATQLPDEISSIRHGSPPSST